MNEQLKNNILIGLGLAVAILIVFGRSVAFPTLLYGDQANICANANLTQSFSSGVSSMLLQSHDGIYTPVTFAVWQFVTSFIKGLGGNDCSSWATALHFINILLHIFNGILVFFVLRMWLVLDSDKWAWLGAFFYSLHPLQAEPVAWISGTPDLLTITFGLAALLVFQQHLWIFSTFLFTLAMLAKPTGLVFPLLALLMIARKKSDRTLLYGAAPPLLIALLVVFITNLLQKNVELPFQLSLLERPMLYLQSAGFYLIKTILPINLVPDYARSIFEMRANQGLFAPAIITAVLVTAFLFLKKIEYNFALDWILVSLIPAGGLFAFSFQQYSVTADRFFIIALVGVAYIFTITLQIFEKKEWTMWIGVVLVTYLAALAFLTVGKWKSDEVLFTNNLGHSPKSQLANSHLGDLWFSRNNFATAEDFYKKTIAINPRDSKTRVKLASTLQKMNRGAEAEALLTKAIAENTASAEVYNNLADIYNGRSEFSSAEKYWKQAADLKKNYFAPRFALGQLYLKTNRLQEAEVVLSEAVRINSQDEQARSMFENVRSRLGR